MRILPQVPVWYRLHPVDVTLLLEGVLKALRNLRQEPDAEQADAISTLRMRMVQETHRQTGGVVLGRGGVAVLLELWESDCIGRDAIEEAYLGALDEEFRIQAASRTVGRETEPGPLIATSPALVEARTTLVLAWGDYLALSRRWPDMFRPVPFLMGKPVLTSRSQLDENGVMNNDDDTTKKTTDDAFDDVIRNADREPVAILMYVEEGDQKIEIGVFTSQKALTRARFLVTAARPYIGGPQHLELPLNP
jgi:hypothetical protein